MVKTNSYAKFVGQGDIPGYSGFTATGFVYGEDENELGFAGFTISRTNTATLVGKYPNDLLASGITAANYSITYQPGDYTILPAEQLLVKFKNQSFVCSGISYKIRKVKYKRFFLFF